MRVAVFCAFAVAYGAATRVFLDATLFGFHSGALFYVGFIALNVAFGLVVNRWTALVLPLALLMAYWDERNACIEDTATLCGWFLIALLMFPARSPG